jgi:hypothetical protein
MGKKANMRKVEWKVIFDKAGFIRTVAFISFSVLAVLFTRYVWSVKAGPYIDKARFATVFWTPLFMFFTVAAITILIAEAAKWRRKISRNQPVFNDPADLVSRIGLLLVFVISALLGWLLGITINLTFDR